DLTVRGNPRCVARTLDRNGNVAFVRPLLKFSKREFARPLDETVDLQPPCCKVGVRYYRLVKNKKFFRGSFPGSELAQVEKLHTGCGGVVFDFECVEIRKVDQFVTVCNLPQHQCSGCFEHVSSAQIEGHGLDTPLVVDALERTSWTAGRSGSAFAQVCASS